MTSKFITTFSKSQQICEQKLKLITSKMLLFAEKTITLERTYADNFIQLLQSHSISP